MVKKNEFDAKTFLASCSTRAGVYQMFDEAGEHLYIGKAKNLKNRLSSYFRVDHPNPKTGVMVNKIARIDVTITASETEALILERSLINQQRPPYNVVFRDDKSYPYIFLSDHKHPRLQFYRGAKNRKGKYFGPFPSSNAVRESLNILQKMFKVRQCEDTYYANRSRPCLQYQIGRCSAPCVNAITGERYRETVKQSTLFLEGKNDDLGKQLKKQMDAAALDMRYEEAAEKRDQITYLRHVQEKQFVEGMSGDTDIIAAEIANGSACIQVLYVRKGRILGSRSHYPKLGATLDCAELLEAFLSHNYLARTRGLGSTPKDIITSHQLDEAEQLAELISEHAGKKVSVSHKVRAQRAKWVVMAADTARQNLQARLASRQQIAQRFVLLQQDLELDELPNRIECFDISHSSGEQTVASCVVFDKDGAKKSDYRKFNIEGITGGDDYAAMKQAITRRFKRLAKAESEGKGTLPDILLVDGGKGQMTQAREVFEELEISNVLLIGVAKGSTRKAGFETLYVDSIHNEVSLDSDAPSLHLIQQIRDEAHRFAITGHRARRAKKRTTSPLEGIAGVGPKRRQQLLKHFGGWQEVERASIEDLANVEGISKKIANDIYAALHDS